jgi:hypothetical protein
MNSCAEGVEQKCERLLVFSHFLLWQFGRVADAPQLTHVQRRIAAAISRLGGEDMVAFGKVGRATAAKGTSTAPPTEPHRGEINRIAV